MIDLSSLPGGGRFVVALALYAGVSIAAGQLVAGRMIDTAGWVPTCEQSLKADIAARRPSPPPARKPTDCESRFGWMGLDVARLCHQFGNPDLELPQERLDREAAELRHRLRERALADAAAKAGSRCECAAAQYRRENLVELGVYAGSARMISLPEVEGMGRELDAALQAPACLPFAEARP